MPKLKTAALFLALVAAFVLAAAPRAIAQNGPEKVAVTIEITDGLLTGHTIPGMVVANQTCSYRDHYHFELTLQGELRVRAPILCGTINAGGGELVCFLSPELGCEARTEFSIGAGGSYSADSSGVRANGKLYAWADPAAATQVLAGARDHAVDKCNHTLYFEALEAKRTTPNPLLPETIQKRKACKPMLERLCASAHGNAALLENGKDVSILCPR